MTDWEHLLTQHGPAMVRSACRILGDANEAEDVVQEVFLDLIGKRGQPDTGDQPDVRDWPALLGWLTTMRSLDRLRRRRRSRETGPDALTSASGPCGQTAEWLSLAEIRDWLQVALAELPPRRAEVFVLRCFGEMSYEQIASVLGVERNAVGVALHAARQQLQAMLPAAWIEGWKVRCGDADA